MEQKGIETNNARKAIIKIKKLTGSEEAVEKVIEAAVQAAIEIRNAVDPAIANMFDYLVEIDEVNYTNEDNN